MLKKISRPVKKTWIAFFEKLKNLSNIKKGKKKVQAPTQDNPIDKEAKKMKWRYVRYAPRFLSPKEKTIVKLSLAIIIIALLGLGYLFVRDNLVIRPEEGGIYTEAIIGSPQHINPLYAIANEVDRDITSLVFASLLKFDRDQNIVGDLASEWFIDDTKTQYTIKLKEKIYWLDEKEFSSEDVVFTIKAIQNPAYQSPLKQTWTGIDVEAIDKYTVKFTLPEPFAPFLENLTIGILPAHLWMDILPENARIAELNLKPIGLGPFQFETLNKDKQGVIKSYTLLRNEKYHGKKPYLEEVGFKFYMTFVEAVDALKNKNVDGISYLPQNEKDILDTRKDIKIYNLSLPQYTALFINEDKNDLLTSNEIREVLRLATPKEQIISEALESDGVATDSPFVNFFNLQRPTSTEVVVFDEKKAEEKLESLGWKIKETEDGEKNETSEAPTSTEANEVNTIKTRFKDDKPLRVTITTTNQEIAQRVAKKIQESWQGIGIETIIKGIDANKIQSEIIRTRDFEILLFGEILGSDPDPYSFWHSSQANEQGFNLANYKNKEVDSLIEKARKESDATKRNEYYIQIEELINKDIPAVFLYSPKYNYAVSNKIKGIEKIRIINPTERLKGIEYWYTKTKKKLSLKKD